jgi:hypothetical protein
VFSPAVRALGFIAMLAMAPEVRSMDVERELQETASHINRTVPRPIGHGAALEEAEAYERTLKYRFSFKELEKDQLSSHFVMKQTEFLTDFVCDKPEMKVFVDNGVTLKYAYYDRHGKVITIITVDAGTCVTE